jgi:hypothetical protein
MAIPRWRRGGADIKIGKEECIGPNGKCWNESTKLEENNGVIDRVRSGCAKIKEARHLNVVYS